MNKILAIAIILAVCYQTFAMPTPKAHAPAAASPAGHGTAHGTGAAAHGTGAAAHGTGAAAHGTGAAAHGTGAAAHGTGAAAHGTGAAAHGTGANGAQSDHPATPKNDDENDDE